ncbi:MAG: asparagine--tRNA ligase [Chlamydiales bacterium]|nr:asparagine--tRNA ligase [Chlamydiales bacterium]
MIPRTKINDLKFSDIGSEKRISGWVRTVRSQKSFTFVEVNDGSSLSNLQIIVDHSIPCELTTGCSVSVTGKLVESPGHQKFEMQATSMEVHGPCPADSYPLQKKRHSFEFLRTIAHLRPRTNTQGAVARVRSRLAYSTHRFFQERGFLYLQSPIITSSDCEGAGQMFKVTTLDLEKTPKTPEGVDYSKDFFHKPTFLTVSGQLNAEAYACALSDVYTFGPTFRAENSHTQRHIAEFWMVEPELAFADLSTVMDCARDYVKFLIADILEHCTEDMQFFDKFLENGLIDRLTRFRDADFATLSYTEAIAILQKSNRSFDYKPEWGIDLQTEHERFLAEEHCKCPLFITNYPKEIKAFYMRDNDDGKTVAATDLIVPNIGELIGGSQREERLNILEKKLTDHNLDLEVYQWYLDLRRYGTVPHGGFGLGFERLIQFVTGVENIRDVNAFPRVPGHAEF